MASTWTGRRWKTCWSGWRGDAGPPVGTNARIGPAYRQRARRVKDAAPYGAVSFGTASVFGPAGGHKGRPYERDGAIPVL